jgi:N-acyl-D-aspartate/D-glutamate deacylase
MKLSILFTSALVYLLGATFAISQTTGPDLDVLITNGIVYDGSGQPGKREDVGIRGDKIVAVGNLAKTKARTIIDAKGLAVAPGFINMLSWSNESLIADGRSQGELRQGVTTQIMGEGWSMGPLNDRLKKQMIADQTDIKYPIEWTTLADYLKYLERRGVSQNVGSYIGATTIRQYVIGDSDVPPTPEQLEQMRSLVRDEMEHGALGIGTALIYPPGFYANTEELIELCKVAAQYKGKYITHMRSEGNQLLEAINEVIRISREAKIPAQIYHLKAAGKDNWGKMDAALALVNKARSEGLNITANMYTYPAGATGLTASLPPWTLDGGFDDLIKRLKDPETRKKIANEVNTPTDKWENLFLAAGSPDRIVLVGFKSDKLKPLTGKTLADIAKLRGTDPADTIMDLIVEDGSQIGTIYFLMSEENIKKQFKQPWVSLGSDAASMAPEGIFLKSSTHPRAYGNFARFLGKYVRDEKIMSLSEGIRRLTGLPATNLGLDGRGFIKIGMFADVVIFDPAAITDKATFEKPHQYSVGVRDVFVNGTQVLKNGEHTGAKPGRAVWGPGKVK